MYNNRLKVIFGLVIAVFVLLVVRLGYLQIIEGAKYAGISKKRLLRERPVPARRGNIYDRRGRPLAVEEPAFDIAVSYKNLLYAHLRKSGRLSPSISRLKAHKDLSAGCDSCHTDTGLWVTRLSNLLETPPEALLEQADAIIQRVKKIKQQVQRRHKKTIWIQEEFASHAIARDVPLQRAAAFESNQDFYPGVSLVTRPKRFYPYRDTASHILGYLGKVTPEELDAAKLRATDSPATDRDEPYDHRGLAPALSADTRVGRAGIEGYYNLDLTGRSGRRVEEISLESLDANKTVFNMPPSHGYDIYLALDLDIQRQAEECLGERKGSIVVLDTRTGGVLAMASYPRFDPNTFGADYGQLLKNQDKPLLNRSIQALLPPGSTFKMVTALTALAEGKIDLNTHFYCAGAINVGNRRFRCTSSHGNIDLKSAIERSCNVYFFETAKRLNGKAINGWARKFGFGDKTGIDLPFEATGNVPLPKYTGERLNVSIGQGDLLVTPLQMAQMVSTIANDGRTARPHLLRKVVTDDGAFIRKEETDDSHLAGLPGEDFLPVREAMRQVVIGGTARRKGLEQLGVAGKTGTAQIGSGDKNHLWFVGYAPFNAPRYAFCVVLERTPGHSGSVAAPVARQLIAGILETERKNKQFAAKRKAGTVR
jgi:penicillin-binding protein 2